MKEVIKANSDEDFFSRNTGIKKLKKSDDDVEKKEIESQKKKIESQKKEKKDSSHYTNSEEHIQTEEEEHLEFSFFIRKYEDEFVRIEQESFDVV